MANITVKPVRTRTEKKQFLTLPWKINRDDPNWIPPLRQNQRELVGFSSHPFYERNLGQTFLAFRGDEPVGRVAAIINYSHIERYNEELGFFGFFESIDDQEVANGLLAAAREWLAEHDLNWIRGPVNPSLNYDCGTLIDGFDTPPTFMMPHNLPYYGKLLENAGFGKIEDLYAFLGHIDMMEGLDKKLDFVIHEATKRFDIKTRRLDTRRFMDELRMFLDIYNQSLAGTWGYTPLSPGEIEHMGQALRRLIVPEMTSVAEVDGRPIAACFGLLDYNPRIKQIDGRLFPFGFIRLLSNRRKIKRVRLLSTNVLPEYQRWGVGLVLTAGMVPDVLAYGIEEAEFSWVLESNSLSFKTLKRGGAKITKRYRIYDCPPPAPAEA